MFVIRESHGYPPVPRDVEVGLQLHVHVLPLIRPRNQERALRPVTVRVTSLGSVTVGVWRDVRTLEVRVIKSFFCYMNDGISAIWLVNWDKLVNLLQSGLVGYEDPESACNKKFTFPLKHPFLVANEAGSYKFQTFPTRISKISISCPHVSNLCSWLSQFVLTSFYVSQKQTKNVRCFRNIHVVQILN